MGERSTAADGVREAVADAPVRLPGMPVAKLLTAPLSPGTARVLQRSAGNRATGRVLARQQAPPPPAVVAPVAPKLSNPADVLHPPWLSVIPWAAESVSAYSVYDASGAKITFGTRSGDDLAKKYALEGSAPPPPPPPPAATGQPATPPDPAQVAADAAAKAKRDKEIADTCAAIDANRAKLAGWAFPGRLPLTGDPHWRGPAGYTRETDRSRPKKVPQLDDKGKVVKDAKNKPVMVDPTTPEQEAAIASAKGYIDFLAAKKAAIGSVTPPAPPAADADQAAKDAYARASAAWLQALKAREFFEVSTLEGGPDSINVWDSQILTWGAGIGSASGQASTVMYKVATDRTNAGGREVGAEVTRALHEVGIALAPRYAGGTATGGYSWVMVDTAGKRVFRDDDATFLMKADPRLLMLLVHIARGEVPGLTPAPVPPPADPSAAPDPAATAAAQAAADAAFKDAVRSSVFDTQKEYFLYKYKAGSESFDTQITALAALGWPMEAIHVVLHMQWWGAGSTSWRWWINGELADDTDAKGRVIGHHPPRPTERYPGEVALVKRVAEHPVLKGRTRALGSAILFPGDFGSHITQYLLGKVDDAWEAPTDPVDAKDTEAGEYYAEVADWSTGKRLIKHRRLKTGPKTKKPDPPADAGSK